MIPEQQAAIERIEGAIVTARNSVRDPLDLDQPFWSDLESLVALAKQAGAVALREIEWSHVRESVWRGSVQGIAEYSIGETPLDGFWWAQIGIGGERVDSFEAAKAACLTDWRSRAAKFVRMEP